ncbi:MAG: hypothetical protein MR413_06440 [Clostridia bacterium]|nr:hypothetical protein [Clostridia bacterium]
MLTREQAHELLDLCLDINGDEKRQRSKTGELPTTFFYFSGHTCEVDISVHENGWEPNANADKDLTVYFNEVYGDRYEEVKDYLLQLKKMTAELQLETVKGNYIE